MTIFLTKVWGFGEPCGPLQFSSKGWRDNALAQLQPSDLVVLVGTRNERTDEEDKGRVIGMMEPTDMPVFWRDFALETRPEDFVDGQYKWPFGLLNRHAWIFLNPPLLSEISSRRFSMDSAQGIVPLESEEAERILALPRREIDLLAHVRTRARLEGEEAARRRGAPQPTTERKGVMHMRYAPAYTYAMLIDRADAASFKIGWAFDYEIRQWQFNQASLPELGGLLYQTRLKELWATAMEAFVMEQRLLRKFDSKRHSRNREVICDVSFQELESAWIECITNIKHR